MTDSRCLACCWRRRTRAPATSWRTVRARGWRIRSWRRSATGLAERGIATLRYQFPYMERGSRRPDAPRLAHATVRAAVDEAARQLPGVPLLAGGKSFGGRMTSQAQAQAPLPGVRGLMFLGFPLHPAGKPSDERAAHLSDVDVPMLFLQGTRDELADTRLLQDAGGAAWHARDAAVVSGRGSFVPRARAVRAQGPGGIGGTAGCRGRVGGALVRATAGVGNLYAATHSSERRCVKWVRRPIRSCVVQPSSSFRPDKLCRLYSLMLRRTVSRS